MRLPTLDASKYTIREQLDKIKEEVAEVEQAIEDGLTLRQLLSECWDVIQATKTLIYIICRGRLEMIRTTNQEHCRKLQDRESAGQIKTNGEWRILMLTEEWTYDK
jgi:hypothetical protein